MLFEKIVSKGLAQNSYLIGDGALAAVIDPRRDCDIYIDLARQEGMNIAIILETHRHEDFAAGSVLLAQKTGARIWHADPQLPYAYGEAAEPGQTWNLGDLSLMALHTPGHTEGSRSYVLNEPGGNPWMVFTGDVLFTGEVGRTDFLGMDRAEEMSGKLYDSIQNSILPLGDGVILWPGHGYGSACGSTIADRPLSTLGLEKQLNARLLQVSREMFVQTVARQLPKPIYFEKMEGWNLEGTPALPADPALKALTPLAFRDRLHQLHDVVAIDLRGMAAYMGGHIHGALAIPLDSLPSYIGWFVAPEQPILLIPDRNSDVQDAALYLHRQGYDNLVGYLAGGMGAWLMDDLPITATPWITPSELNAQMGSNVTILDVRAPKEAESGVLPEALVVQHKLLLHQYAVISPDKPVVAYCVSGPRSVAAVSILEHKGYKSLGVLSGGILAWRQAGFGLE